MKKNIENDNFKSFLNLFPEIELPVTISSEYYDIFSKYNKPIPEIDIHEFILFDNSSEPILEEENNPSKIDKDSYEEEYIACLKLPDTKNFHALVYLKIGILNYEYILQTYDLDGNILSKQLIASMTAVDDIIKELVAFIDEDLIILIMQGDKNINEKYNPEKSKALSYEINDQGYVLKYKI